MIQNWKRWGAIVLFFPLALLSLELILRASNPPALRYYRDVKLLHAYHPEYGVTLEPNESLFVRHYADLWQGQFTTNSLGLRGREEPISGKPKLICLGDSLVMGFGVSDEDTFCSKLGSYEENGISFQSLNLGVDAYGSLGSYKRLKDMSTKIDNIKTVLFFISPNDFTMPEELRAQGILPDDENDAIHENDPIWKKNFRLQFELTRISYLLQALKLAYEQTKVKLAQTKYLVKTDTLLLSTSPFVYLRETFILPIKQQKCAENKDFVCPAPLQNLNVICSDTPVDPNSLEPLPETTTRAYDLMIALSKEKGYKFVPVILPMQIEEVYCRQMGKYNTLGGYAIRAKKYLDSKGIQTLDILPYTDKMCGREFTLRGQTKKAGIQDYYIPGDGHLTKLGNLWAAESIKEALKEIK
ncbi:lipase [Leptospira sp. 2 VSF19]|uniref:Lipase n=1 Tax=Leptospira soteropolitanensis TaxID=2950025 RepID=A0AAW5VI83_9LEPT|nr:lipase [Leptospira soteropolitanensis]MCW7493693.1 lipase [Leptospira soteropolitanensis]MCW7501291.1 lipase [Leptospira soteropolitanensis]MCW7523523.1 lipase [Leptospira soteropolitanensis]MCW7527405.1 lipase [Leptospira soteropolitanensis]MCW7531261.1 lipase [Leptospira soteropolitanensis]